MTATKADKKVAYFESELQCIFVPYSLTPKRALAKRIHHKRQAEKQAKQGIFCKEKLAIKLHTQYQ